MNEEVKRKRLARLDDRITEMQRLVDRGVVVPAIMLEELRRLEDQENRLKRELGLLD